MKGGLSLIIGAFTCLLVGCSVAKGATTGFVDQGFKRPEIVSDINSLSYWIAPCRYPGQRVFPEQLNRYHYDNGRWYEVINSHSKTIDPCQHTGLVFNQQNHYQSFAVADPIPRSWVLSANFEPAFLTGLAMPNQSLPVENQLNPSSAFVLQINESSKAGKRLYLSVNARHRVSGQLGLPFLGVGAFANRTAQGKPLGHLATGKYKRQNDRLLFSLTAVDSLIQGVDQPLPIGEVKQYSGLQLFLFSRWQGENRMISLGLAYGSGIADLGIKTWLTKKWNWPIYGSYFDGGAELVYTTGKAVKQLCGMDTGFPDDYLLTANTQDQGFIPRDYQIDLSKLFRCLSDHGAFSETMPEKAPLTGVLWAVEATASSQEGGLYGDSLAVVLENMRLD